ncbi:MAG: DUF4846 domain-containing protein [Flavobacteriales bacterium]|nr:DUF4846 domain-containing protein [Flavobacteriales bacterium]
MKPFLYLLLPLTFLCCGSVFHPSDSNISPAIIHPDGQNISTRIDCPEGFHRTSADSGSFAFFLRQLKLKPDGSPVLLYTGEEKLWQHVHCAVIDMEIGTKDLQQCADACIRLRAEYLWQQKKYDDIHFNLTNGFRMDYRTWREGNRLSVSGNNTSWVKKTNPDYSYQSFREYLNTVFMYAGTLSVEKEIVRRDILKIEPGDIFVVGGSPGHAAMVIDVAENAAGERVFLLAQGYMPAQEIHIIKNPQDELLSPWFSNQFTGELETMEWTFPNWTLGRFN